MEFWRAWSIPASGPEFPQAGVLDTFESPDGEIRICIRVLNEHAPQDAAAQPESDSAA